MGIACAALLLVFVMSSAAAEPFAVSPPVDVGPAAGWRRNVNVTTNGDSVLVVWNDERGGNAVRGAMLDRNHQLASDRDFLISPLVSSDYAFSDELEPVIFGRGPLAVASDGKDYLAAHTMSEGTEQRWQTRFTRVTAEGKVETAVDALDGVILSMASVGGFYFAAIREQKRAWAETKVAIVDPHGRVVRAKVPLVDRNADLTRDAMLLATEDGKLLLAWESRRYYGAGVALVNPADLFDSAYIGAQPAARIDGMQLSLSGLAEGNDGFLIAGIDRDRDEELLMLAVLDRDGALRKREDVRSRPQHAYIQQLFVTRAGNGYSVVAGSVFLGAPWGAAEASLYVTEDGDRPLGDFKFFGWHEVGSSVVLRKRDASLFWVYITWEDNRVEIAPVSVTGNDSMTAGDGLLLSRTHPAQGRSAVAQCNGTTIVAWRDQWNGPGIVRIRRFSPTGQALDPPNRRLGASIATADQFDVAITCGRTNALLTWRESSDQQRTPSFVRGAILRQDGTLFDLGQMGRADRVLTLHDGRSFLMLTYSYDGPDFWQSWSEQGSRLAIAAMPELDQKNVWELALAWNGSYLMAVWLHRTAKGMELRAREFTPAFIATGPELELEPQSSLLLAGRPGGWLLTWRRCIGWPYVCHTYTSGLNGGDAVASMESSVPLRLSWNGVAWELLGEKGVTLLDESGRKSSFRHLTRDDEKVEAMTKSGKLRLFTFLRTDPETGVSQLYADVIHESLLETNRRRGARP